MENQNNLNKMVKVDTGKVMNELVKRISTLEMENAVLKVQLEEAQNDGKQNTES